MRLKPTLSPRAWKRIAIAAIASAAAVMVAVPLALSPFRKAAAKFDLEAVTQIEGGARVVARDGSVLGPLTPQARRLVTFDDLPAHLIDALVATEDRKFFDHGGYDPAGILRAATANLRSARVRQGASTVTQQLARQTYELYDNTLARKLTEIFAARRIEGTYSKEQILEAYFNRVYFGSGLYGIGAAAHGYFSKPVAELTAGEAAVLVGLLKRPNAYSPLRSLELAKEGRDHVLRGMAECGFLETGEAERLVAEPVAVREGTTPLGAGGAGYAIQEAARQLVANQVSTHGEVTVATTIDAETQGALAGAIAGYLAGKPEDLQVAAIIVANRSGEVLANVGGRDFETTPFDRSFGAMRPLGTLMAPLVYAAALERGASPGTPVEDFPLDNRRAMVGGTLGILGEWGMQAPADYRGFISAHEAIRTSRNGATVRIGEEAGLNEVLALARRTGIEDGRTPLRPLPSSLLGQTETSLERIALAYSLFGSGGQRPAALTLVRSVVADGEEPRFEARPPTSVNVLSEDVSELVRSTFDQGTRRVESSYERDDVWAVAISRESTAALWIGFDRPAPVPRSIDPRELLDRILAAAPSSFPGRVPLPAPPPPPALPEPAKPSLPAAEASSAGSVVPESPALLGQDPYGAIVY